jgi:hypothetical protein
MSRAAGFSQTLAVCDHLEMEPYGDDIYTEPDADPNTLANLGPLTPMAGTWESRRGDNLHPIGAGSDRDGGTVQGGGLRTGYVEHYDLQPIDPQTNGPQLFYGLRYHVHIVKPGEVETFHDQVGYWLWEPATGLVLQTLAIPRGQVLLASGQATADADRIVVTAERGHTDYGICSTAFLEYAFRTDRYQIEIDYHADGSWSYSIETVLSVRGQDAPFVHRDRNTLFKIEEPQPNPLARIIAAKAATA